MYSASPWSPLLPSSLEPSLTLLLGAPSYPNGSPTTRQTTSSTSDPCSISSTINNTRY